jgi:endo-1,4-beta-xylanase
MSRPSRTHGIVAAMLGLTDTTQQALAAGCAALFQLFLKRRDVIDRVTFWSAGDGDSWLFKWPVRGRVGYPLLVDAQDYPKPAVDAVIRTARQDRARR